MSFIKWAFSCGIISGLSKNKKILNEINPYWIQEDAYDNAFHAS
jgi:hypothetical protein